MGSLCSKGTASSDDVIQRPQGSNSRAAPSARPVSAAPSQPRTRTKARGKGHTLGDSTGDARPADPRAAAAEAAEQRLKAAQTRGVVASNPKKGKLAAQLEASKAAPRVPEPRQEEQLVWD